MGKYSVIRTEIENMQQAQKPQPMGILSAIFSGQPRQRANVPVTLKVPEYDLLRAEVFLEDVMDAIQREVEVSIVELIALLIRDFLRMTSSNAKMEDLMKTLLQKKQEFLSIKEKVQEWVEVAPGHSSLREKERVRRRRSFYINLEIARKTALRLEVILYDIEQQHPSFQMTLEELITVIFMEFIQQLQTGKQKDIVKRFINNFC